MNPQFGGTPAANLPIFVEQMATGGSSPLLNTGVNLNASTGSPYNPAATMTFNPDIFATIIRYTLPASLNSWIGNAPTNILVFRSEAPTSVAASTFNTPNLNNQSCNNNETTKTTMPTPPASCVLDSGISADLNDLAMNLNAAVVSRYASETYAMHQAGSPAPGGGAMFPAITNGTDQAGGTQDTDAYRSYELGQLSGGGPVFIVGALHSASVSDTSGTTAQASNDATYNGLSIADDENSQNEGEFDFAQSNVAATGFTSPLTLTGSAAAVVADWGIGSSLRVRLESLFQRAILRSSSMVDAA